MTSWKMQHIENIFTSHNKKSGLNYTKANDEKARQRDLLRILSQSIKINPNRKPILLLLLPFHIHL